jgi:hypothetical protein
MDQGVKIKSDPKHRTDKMARKTKFDSVAGALETEAAAVGTIDPPAFCEPLSGEDRERWDAYIRGRVEWREIDLMTLYEVVYLDAEIARIKETLAGVDDVEFSGQGAPIAHPLHNVINQKMNLRLSLLRGMSLNLLAQHGKSQNASGVKAKPPVPKKKAPARTSRSKKPDTPAEKKAKALSLVT